MPRNITAAQKRAHVFYKSDVLAQTNQIKYNNNFFRMVHKTQKKRVSQDLRVETKIPGMLLFCTVIVEKY